MTPSEKLYSDPTAYGAEREAVYSPPRVVLCRSWPRSVLVKSDANDWSDRMQADGQVECNFARALESGNKHPESQSCLFFL